VERFEICLGAILTQNTSWTNVEKVLSSLKRNNLLELTSFLALSVSEMEKHLRSSGYFRQKAARVKTFLQIIRKESNGNIRTFLRGKTNVVRKKLLTVKGIGPETADSMLLYAGAHPIFVVDAYTKRIGSRWRLLRESASYDQVQKLFAACLPSTVKAFGEMHALLVKLGKDFCFKRQPNCKDCPLRKECPTGDKEQ
jgi:endonuclease-3 related protein